MSRLSSDRRLLSDVIASACFIVRIFCPFTGRGGGRDLTILFGSNLNPIACNLSASNKVPASVLRHSRIIHRRGMRAREYLVLFLTDPPPTSIVEAMQICG